MLNTTERVTGEGSGKSLSNLQIQNTKTPTFAPTVTLLIVNVFLSFAVIVLFLKIFLAKESNPATISFTNATIIAVTTIMVNVLLSIFRWAWKRRKQ